MKILIIGGARFIGPCLVRELLPLGHELTVFNRGRHPGVLPPEIKFVAGDRAEGFPAWEGFDAVIDTCAYTPDQIETVKKQINFDFYLFVSTAAVYQKTEVFPLREDTSAIGDWPLWAEYNRGKVACEKYLLALGQPYASIRPVYILGPGNYVDREAFIYRQLAAGQTLTLPGNGQALAQFVFAYDVARLMALIIAKRATGAFNCCPDQAVTLFGLVSEMSSIVSRPAFVNYNPAADGIGFRVDEFPFANENFFCSSTRALTLGFVPTPLSVGLRQDYEAFYKGYLSDLS